MAHVTNPKGEETVASAIIASQHFRQQNSAIQ